jgi:hypothetical protein
MMDRVQTTSTAPGTDDELGLGEMEMDAIVQPINLYHFIDIEEVFDASGIRPTH